MDLNTEHSHGLTRDNEKKEELRTVGEIKVFPWLMERLFISS